MKSDDTNRRFFLGAAVIFILFGIVLRFSFLDKIARTPDERVINNYASTLHALGVRAGLATMVEQYRTQPDNWFYPSVSRAGYYVLVYATQSLLGERTVESAAYVAVASSIVALIVSVWLAYYLYGGYAAFLVSILVSASSLSLSSSRRNWNESFVELSMIALIAIAFVMARQGRIRHSLGMLFLVLGAFSITVKESAFLNIGFAALIPFVSSVLDRNWRGAVKIALLALGTAGAGVGLVILAVGGYDNLAMIFQNYTKALPLNRYAVDYQDGPATDFLRLFYILSPGMCYFVFLGVLCYLAAMILGRRRAAGMACTTGDLVEHRFQHFSHLLLEAIIVLFLIASSIPKYFKNLRYASPLYDLLPIFAVFPIVLVICANHGSARRQIVLQVLGVCFALYCAYLDLTVWRDVMIEKPGCLDWNILLLTQCGALGA